MTQITILPRPAGRVILAPAELPAGDVPHGRAAQAEAVPTPDREESGPLLVARVGDLTFSVPAVQVNRVVVPPNMMTPIPMAESEIRGLFSHASNPAMAVSLHRKFGLSDPNDWKSGFLLLANHDAEWVAFWVDEVLGLTDTAGLKWVTLPPHVPRTVFDGVLFFEDRLVLTTDVPHLTQSRAEEAKQSVRIVRNLESVKRGDFDSISTEPPEDMGEIEPPQEPKAEKISVPDGHNAEVEDASPAMPQDGEGEPWASDSPWRDTDEEDDPWKPSGDETDETDAQDLQTNEGFSSAELASVNAACITPDFSDPGPVDIKALASTIRLGLRAAASELGLTNGDRPHPGSVLLDQLMRQYRSELETAEPDPHAEAVGRRAEIEPDAGWDVADVDSWIPSEQARSTLSDSHKPIHHTPLSDDTPGLFELPNIPQDVTHQLAGLDDREGGPLDQTTNEPHPRVTVSECVPDANIPAPVRNAGTGFSAITRRIRSIRLPIPQIKWRKSLDQVRAQWRHALSVSVRSMAGIHERLSEVRPPQIGLPRLLWRSWLAPSESASQTNRWAAAASIALLLGTVAWLAILQPPGLGVPGAMAASSAPPTAFGQMARSTVSPNGGLGEAPLPRAAPILSWQPRPATPGPPNPSVSTGRDNADRTSGRTALLMGGSGYMLYVVKKGDTLWDITEDFLGNPFLYPMVATTSGLPNPDQIAPGDVITIPLPPGLWVPSSAGYPTAVVTVSPG